MKKLLLFRKEILIVKKRYFFKWNELCCVYQRWCTLLRKYVKFVHVPPLPSDVIGVCKSVSDVTAVTIKSSNREVNKRSLQLVDDSQKEVSLTLWGKEVSPPSFFQSREELKSSYGQVVLWYKCCWSWSYSSVKILSVSQCWTPFDHGITIC